MSADLWYIVIGALFAGIAFSRTLISRLPLTTAVLYFAAGYVLGPRVLGAIQIDLVRDSEVLERLAEIAMLGALFTAGLKLRVPLSDARWRAAARLAFGSMACTIAMVATAGVVFMGLPAGAAILLGSIVAPTDPVLASEVQVEHAFDASRLRFALTGEAGLNDGGTFPFVMLGLGMMHLTDLGAGGWRWILLDLVWGPLGGLAIGAALGVLVSRYILHLRIVHRVALGGHDYIALGLMALCYGVSQLCQTYGFIAVFAAGYAMRWVEMEHGTDEPVRLNPSVVAATSDSTAELSADPNSAGMFLTQGILAFNEHFERMAEFTMVTIFGILFSFQPAPANAGWFLVFLFLLVRPLSVELALVGSGLPLRERVLIGWFGIRGVGSLYYLVYAINRGLPGAHADVILRLTLFVVAASIWVHGISATPIMRRYGDMRNRP